MIRETPCMRVEVFLVHSLLENLDPSSVYGCTEFRVPPVGYGNTSVSST